MLSPKEILILTCGIVVMCLIILGYHTESFSNSTLCPDQVQQIKNYLLPTDDVIDKMDNDSIYLVFEQYTTSTQFYCGAPSRLGPDSGSGKNVCLDKQVKPVSSSCIVYSFGSKLDFAFETATWNSFKCQIHTFDPSIAVDSKDIPYYINYHLLGLSGRDFIQEQPEVWRQHDRPLERVWRMQRLSTILKQLSHTDKEIDILKIDIEGFEWETMSDIIQSGALKNVKQLCLEVHFGFSYKHVVHGKSITLRFTSNTWGNVTMAYQLKVFSQLYKAGFRIFMYDALDWGSRHIKGKTIHTLNELSLINLKFYD
ncbi:probable methyltransferase-like protein 24 [Ruditapes philippinarum]|uniref:probable methyltransferase-like protein 24 n=1 Tax=Ruditapes philippinarum TaxID=129788 RepID=UPI00295AA5A3|nr:probable methyltransferase-like protein 24 [Ruditapes philippinarum]